MCRWDAVVRCRGRGSGVGVGVVRPPRPHSLGTGLLMDCCISPDAVRDLWCIDYEVHQRSVVHHTPRDMFISFGIKTKVRTRCNSDTWTGPYPGLTKGGSLIRWGGGIGAVLT